MIRIAHIRDGSLRRLSRDRGMMRIPVHRTFRHEHRNRDTPAPTESI